MLFLIPTPAFAKRLPIPCNRSFEPSLNSSASLRCLANNSIGTKISTPADNHLTSRVQIIGEQMVERKSRLPDCLARRSAFHFVWTDRVCGGSISSGDESHATT